MKNKEQNQRFMRLQKSVFVGGCVGMLLLSGLMAQAAGGTDSQKDAETQMDTEMEDGIYLAEFHTDSSMFHVNEADDGKGTLTVKDGEMVLHISMPSKNVVHLFAGLAEDAKKEDAKWLEPTEDTVTYNDGFTEEVYGFDVPVEQLGEEFDLALIGTKGVWYDHRVSVDNPKEMTEEMLEKQSEESSELSKQKD